MTAKTMYSCNPDQMEADYLRNLERQMECEHYNHSPFFRENLPVIMRCNDCGDSWPADPAGSWLKRFLLEIFARDKSSI